MYPKVVARNKYQELNIYVFAEGNNAPAIVAREKPVSMDKAQPLQAIVAHLFLDEWEIVAD